MRILLTGGAGYIGSHTALSLLLNTLMGFLALGAVRLTAGLTGIALGLNLWNALVIAVLGLPGFVLLLLVQWIL